MKKILITGTAGFIGFHLVKELIQEEDWKIVGIDNINDYYDINLKYARLAETGIYACDETDFTDGKNRIYSTIEFNKEIASRIYKNYSFYRTNLEDKEFIFSLFKTYKFDYVINLAAQAGVRYSLENPYAYVNSNLVGFFNILEACKSNTVSHLIYASSSSVYGANSKIPFSENDKVDNPISLYAATKKSNELIAYAYSHLYNIKTTGLRFFTVYGPWGRPDMAYFLFTKAIYENKEIEIFNKGNLERDFTFIGDIIEGIKNVIKKKEVVRDSYKIYNIGNHTPVKLMDFINTLETIIGKQSKKIFLQMQPGDVYRTYANVDQLMNDYEFVPITKLYDGLTKFIDWYKNYYSI